MLEIFTRAFFIENHYYNLKLSIVPLSSVPVGTRYCGDIGFLLDFHRDVDRLRIDIDVTSLYIFSQYHIDFAAIT